MGAFGSNHINFTKGYPNMYAVDLSIPAGAADIVEGMCIHEDPETGTWLKGCPVGRLPYVTGHEQFPKALDVERGDGEMGAGNMGGVSLTNSVEFETTEYSGDIQGQYVFGDTDGLFKPVTDATAQLTCGYCRKVYNDVDGDSVALIVAAVSSVPAAGSPLSSESSSSG